MPAALRERLRQLRPEQLIVIPDGPLHKLPLESLVSEGGLRPKYLLDELPPIVYAPSVATLVLLAERSASGSKGPLSLLTVSDPAYRQRSPFGPNTNPQKLPELLELARGLPMLPGSAEESRAIGRFFTAEQVTSLSLDHATKPAVLAAIPGRRVVHLAAHCFADKRFGDLLGAVALTPILPTKEVSADDGFLSRSEIYTLPLQDCELAILSACVTNVGPQAPLEAGVTVANTFLAAGARRVVASQWEVDDKATAALMEAFVEEITDAAKRGDKLPYARALRQARLKVRARPEWALPFYWAPFVFLGPPD
jgi:CHAT domain-containing protein